VSTTSKPLQAPVKPAGGDHDDPDPDTVRAIEAEVRRYLSGYRRNERGSLGRLAASRNLWREVSSLTLLQLVSFLEQRFGITVRPIDFATQNFENISAIAQFVAAQRPRLPEP
jgi:acyl carrier protein